MKKCMVLAILTAILLAAPFAAYGADSPVPKIYSAHDGKLWFADKERTFTAVDVPGFAAPDVSKDAAMQIVIKIADVGGDAVCFDLFGYTPDGASISDDAVKRVKAMILEYEWRAVGSIVRVLGPGAPKAPAQRLAAVRAAANAFKDMVKAIYLLEGPDAEALAKEYLAIAPKAVVIAPAGGSMDLVTELPAQTGAKPALLVGKFPPKDKLASSSFLLPNTPETYAALEEAFKDPLEGQPWTPDNSNLSRKERKAGWISLFDGKTLNGWWNNGGKNNFSVQDGMIACNGVGGANLYSHDRYDSFILRLEWKMQAKGNSGVFLHAPRGARQSAIGMEFQLQDDYGKPVDKQTVGALYMQSAPMLNAVKPAGEWNTTEIEIRGTHLKATLNGQVVQDLDLSTNEELRNRLKKGFIGLQDHRSLTWFRNIRVKKL